jgi:hypothetical protein
MAGMIPCRHIQRDQSCALGRRPLDCACKAYNGAIKPSREQSQAWAKVMADIGSDRSLALSALTTAAMAGAIMATIGVTAMLMGVWR